MPSEGYYQQPLVDFAELSDVSSGVGGQGVIQTGPAENRAVVELEVSAEIHAVDVWGVAVVIPEEGKWELVDGDWFETSVDKDFEQIVGYSDF